MAQQTNLKPYATLAEGSNTKRKHKQLDNAGERSEFQRDRDRILYSRAFRRLIHKTQVFIAPQGDHFRTRLTHTLEVAQIARTIARAIGVDEDLTEAIALAHDLGHPPFGHVGEEELDRLMREGESKPNGFDHNVQTLRVVTKLESIGYDFQGLNLTAATLEGLFKHHGVIERKDKNDEKKLRCFFPMIKDVLSNFDFDKPASLEAQCACIADEIAYSHHDLEDGLRAKLITIENICDNVHHVMEAHNSIHNRGKLLRDDNHDQRLKRRLISDLMRITIEDAIRNTKEIIERKSISSPADVQKQSGDIVTLSEEQSKKNKALRGFLKTSIYQHQKVIEESCYARYTIDWLFKTLPQHEEQWDPLYFKHYRSYKQGKMHKKSRRVLADYIAGMTDNYAERLHQAIYKKTLSDREKSQTPDKLAALT